MVRVVKPEAEVVNKKEQNKDDKKKKNGADRIKLKKHCRPVRPRDWKESDTKDDCNQKDKSVCPEKPDADCIQDRERHEKNTADSQLTKD